MVDTVISAEEATTSETTLMIVIETVVAIAAVIRVGETRAVTVMTTHSTRSPH